MLLALTRGELRQFGEEISAIVHRWVERSKANGSADGARRPRKGRRRQVFFFAHAFPFESDSESDTS
jgi:hypothetical protein